MSISEDHEVRIYRSPLYANVPTLAKISGVVGAKVSWANVKPSLYPLAPSMIYKLIDRPTCLKSTFSMNRNPRLTVGDSGGKVNIFELVDVISRPPPVVTAQRTSRLRQQRVAVDKFLSVTCPGCNLIFNLSTVPAHAIKVLQKKCRGDHNNRNIAKEFYTDRRLLTYCPRCSMVLRLNAFDSHLPFRFRTEMRQLSRKQHRMEKKPKNAEDEDGNDSDGGSSTATDSPGLSSFIRRKPSGRLKFNIVAFKPQGMDKTMSSKNTTVKFSKSNPRQKSFRTLRRSKSMKAKRNASTMSALGVSAELHLCLALAKGKVHLT